jgi:hypothetical protein
MLSSVLNSERAVEINIEIMRAFVRLREMISSNKDLARKLGALERKVESHDVHIRSLFRSDPPAYGAAGAEEAQDRLPSRRTRRALRQSITGVCIRVFEIAATWQFPSESVLEILNRRGSPRPLEPVERLEPLEPLSPWAVFDRLTPWTDGN